MAESVGQIGLDLVLNSAGFKRQLNSIDTTAKNASDKISSSFKKIATTAVAAFSVKKIADFGKQCVDLGSDLSEVQNVVDVTYSSMSNSLNKWAKNATKSFGLSETMAKKYAGLYGSMAESFGFSEKQAYKMSTALTGLAGDVASFYNITQDEAYTKLKSVFSGETETLKDLGIVMTQSALDSYALQKGLNKTTSAMTEAEKVSLRYSFVTDQLANAQGDFTRTSNSWANQTRVLKLNVDSIKASLGQSFIAVLTPAIKTFNTLIEKIKSCTESFKEFATNAFGANFNDSSTAKVSSAVADTTDNTDNLTESLETANKSAEKLKNNLAGFDKLNVISKQTSNTSNATSAPVTSGLSRKVKLDTSDLDKANNKAKKLNALLNKLGFDKVKKSAKYAFGNILDSIKDIAKSWKRVWSNGTGDRVLTHINSLLTTGLGIVGDISGAFKKAWNKAKLGDSVVQSIIDRADSLITLIDTIGKDFRKVWNDGTGERIWSNIFKYIRNSNNGVATFRKKIKEAWQKNETGKKIWEDILGIVEDITEFLSDMSKIKLDWLKNLNLSPLLTSVEKLVGAFRNLLKVCGDKLKIAYKNVLLPLAKWTIEKAVPELLDMFAKALKWVSDILNNISPDTLYAIAGGISAVVGAIVVFKTGQAIASGISTVMNSLKIFITTLTTNPFLALASAIGGIALAVGTYSELKWSNTEAAKFADEVAKVEESLSTTKDKITQTLTTTLTELDEIYADNTLIDNYQQKLDELISKAELTPKEQSQLETIVTYFKNNVDGFDKVWDQYVKISDRGKVELNGDLKKVRRSIDKTIEKYQTLAKQSALSELATNNSKELIDSNKDLSSDLNKYNKQKKELENKKAEYEKYREQWMKLRKQGKGPLDPEYDDVVSKMNRAKIEYKSMEKSLRSLANTYNETVSKYNELAIQGDELAKIQSVLNGNYSDSASVMLAYNAGLINMQDITKNTKKAFSSIKKEAEDSGKNIVLGLEKGCNAYKDAMVKNSNGLASKYLSEFDKATGIASPSKEMKKRGVWLVEGLTIGVSKKLNSIKTYANKMVEKIQSPFKTIKDWFKNIFTGVWNAIKSPFEGKTIGDFFSGIWSTIKKKFTGIGTKVGDAVGGAFKTAINAVLSTVEKVINTPIKAINSLLGVINGVPGVDIDKLSTFKLPRLAKGGLVKAPTLALVGDNKGASTGNPEVVAPLNKLQGMINSSSNPTDTAILSEILSVLKKIYELFLLFRRQGGSSYEFVAKLSGSVLFDEIVKQDRIYRKCHNGKSAFS